jgi:hypothetical protein
MISARPAHVTLWRLIKAGEEAEKKNLKIAAACHGATARIARSWSN